MDLAVKSNLLSNYVVNAVFKQFVVLARYTLELRFGVVEQGEAVLDFADDLGAVLDLLGVGGGRVGAQVEAEEGKHRQQVRVKVRLRLTVACNLLDDSENSQLCSGFKERHLFEHTA